MARRVALLAAAFATLFPSALLGAPPRPAPPVYATPQYGLTFRSPRGATYCPLRRDWVGSDHGTVVFLEPPRDCGGAGYPSSSRDFSPENVARIDLFYAYKMPDPPPPRPCRAVGATRFLGGIRRMCRTDERDMIFIRVEAPYQADIPAEAEMTLGTRRGRLARDLVVFRRVAATVRTCSPRWPAANGHPPFVVGPGPRCPAGATWF